MSTKTPAPDYAAPWTLEEDGWTYGTDLDGNDWIIATPSIPLECSVVGRENLSAALNAQAEAIDRLKTAAPELLAAAIHAVEIITDSYGEDQIADGDCQACNVLRAAIAKATGAADQ